VVLIIKKIIPALILSLVMNLNPVSMPSVSAKAFFVMNENGEILCSRNADERMLIASTTKIMTAILAIENCSLNDEVRIKDEHCAIEGSSMYLRAGKSYTVSELLFGLMLASGNDAALALAEHTAGSTEAFVSLMNSKARELGLGNTHFSNPHGLNSSEHYSTAADMAKLMVYCMQNSDFARISASRSCEVKGQTYINHNKLLAMYGPCIAGKTGYTEKAGRCLVSCTEENGTRFFCVTLSAPDDWNDHIKLYDYALSHYEMRKIPESIGFYVQLISGIDEQAFVVPDMAEVYAKKDENVELIAYLPQFVFAPVRAGEYAGDFDLMQNGICIGKGKLIYRDDVEIYYK